ncbi:MAG: metallophosphoesterase [Chloroflexi bacterium]|nr:MAG: metallophosphoesterase [Chloroflexota bacterium]
MFIRSKGSQLRIFFATDVHGSETCFRKFVNAATAYSANALILGGDITGKQLALIVNEDGCWRLGAGRTAEKMDSRDALDAARKRLSARGMYPIVVTAEEELLLATDQTALEERFKRERLERVESWMNLAEERLRPLGVPCFVSPGNDDDRDVGEVIHTPWDTPREQSESDIGAHLTAMASQVHDYEGAIFNLHCPPYQSGLDSAPELDASLKPIVRGGEIGMVPVGSTAVRDAIERYQPLLGLHGHIHECRAMKGIGRSICINPGSDYHTATLRGAIVQVSAHKVDAWTLTTG